MEEILEVIAVIRALKFLRDELVGKPGDFGGAAVALAGLRKPRHDRGCSCEDCEERAILAVADDDEAWR